MLKILSMAALTGLLMAAPTFAADKECACDTTCVKACADGKGENCKCEKCECKKGVKDAKKGTCEKCHKKH